MLFFVKQYPRKYNIFEVETLHVGRVWWEVDPYPDPSWCGSSEWRHLVVTPCNKWMPYRLLPKLCWGPWWRRHLACQI